MGIDSAGISRLPVLDSLGIAAADVDASSTQIGDARSTYETGILSHVNDHTRELGACLSMPVKELVHVPTKGR